MARPRKWRKVCSLPETIDLVLLVPGKTSNYITMAVDEYETIRLIDLEGFTRRMPEKMNVAHYCSGFIPGQRKRESLVYGKVLIIEGGEYRLCNGFGENCGRSCHRKRHRMGFSGI